MSKNSQKSSVSTNPSMSEENISELGIQLWDEIAKGIAETMSDQLIPVVNEIYHKHFPPDAEVIFLSTEYLVRKKDKKHAYSKILSDITFQIAGSDDIYHLEFQVTKDGKMSLRMLEYDFHIGLQHGAKRSDNDPVYQIRFPLSAVIYPTEDVAPKQKTESCKIVFQDGTMHTYRVPVVVISDYKLSELIEKRLNIFLPFSILRFRSRLSESSESPVTKKELTDHLRELILGLEDELNRGVIDQKQFHELIYLVKMAVIRVFRNYPDHIKEATKMTERKLKLLSEIIQEKDDEIAEQANEIAEQANEIAEQASEIAEKVNEITKKDNIISALMEQISAITARNTELETENLALINSKIPSST